MDIAYESSGSWEAGVVILIRGQGTQLIHWPESFYEAFSTLGFRTIRFDNRETGLSGKFDGIAGRQLEALKRRIAAGEEIDPPYTTEWVTISPPVSGNRWPKLCSRVSGQSQTGQHHFNRFKKGEQGISTKRLYSNPPNAFIFFLN